MLNLDNYKNGVFPDKTLQGAIGSNLFEIQEETKHDAELIQVEMEGKFFGVEVFKATGSNILQVCSEYKVARGYLGGFGQMTFMDEIAIQRNAIAAYCEKNNLRIRRELAAWSMTRCLIATCNT